MKKRIAALLTALLLAGMALPAAALETGGEKAVYLTFDDGPKKDTPELLALLEELDVPATFFFVGLSVRAFPEHARAVYEKGYAIGCHSMGHSYSRIKQGTESALRDIERFNTEMRTQVDEGFTTDLYRFPGGSGSYDWRIRRAVSDAGYAWFDWNALVGDTMGKKASEMYEYAVKTGGKDEVIILLMHEGKPNTRRILPDLVAYYRERGYTFRMLSTEEAERGFLERCPAKMGLPETGRENVN